MIPRPRWRPNFRENGELFHLFRIAELLGKTVDELLSGQPKPLSNAEFMGWGAYFAQKAKLEDEQSKKSNRGKGKRRGEDVDTDVEPKKTMGRQA